MELRWMKKKTVITSETREVWVIRRPFWVAEEPAAGDSESEPSSESLTLPIDPDAKKDDDSSESIPPDVQE
jgi:hypothetical protein